MINNVLAARSRTRKFTVTLQDSKTGKKYDVDLETMSGGPPSQSELQDLQTQFEASLPQLQKQQAQQPKAPAVGVDTFRKANPVLDAMLAPTNGVYSQSDVFARAKSQIPGRKAPVATADDITQSANAMIQKVQDFATDNPVTNAVAGAERLGRNPLVNAAMEAAGIKKGFTGYAAGGVAGAVTTPIDVSADLFRWGQTGEWQAGANLILKLGGLELIGKGASKLPFVQKMTQKGLDKVTASKLFDKFKNETPETIQAKVEAPPVQPKAAAKTQPRPLEDGESPFGPTTPYYDDMDPSELNLVSAAKSGGLSWQGVSPKHAARLRKLGATADDLTSIRAEHAPLELQRTILSLNEGLTILKADSKRTDAELSAILRATRKTRQKLREQGAQFGTRGSLPTVQETLARGTKPAERTGRPMWGQPKAETPEAQASLQVGDTVRLKPKTSTVGTGKVTHTIQDVKIIGADVNDAGEPFYRYRFTDAKGKERIGYFKQSDPHKVLYSQAEDAAKRAREEAAAFSTEKEAWADQIAKGNTNVGEDILARHPELADMVRQKTQSPTPEPTVQSTAKEPVSAAPKEPASMTREELIAANERATAAGDRDTARATASELKRRDVAARTPTTEAQTAAQKQNEIAYFDEPAPHPNGNIKLSDLRGDKLDEYNRIQLEANAAQRRARVRQALKDGKPVPPEVLADYPDLAKKYKPETPKTEPPVASEVAGAPQSASVAPKTVKVYHGTTEAGFDVPDVSKSRTGFVHVAEDPNFTAPFTDIEQPHAVGGTARTLEFNLDKSKIADPTANPEIAKQIEDAIVAKHPFVWDDAAEQNFIDPKLRDMIDPQGWDATTKYITPEQLRDMIRKGDWRVMESKPVRDWLKENGYAGAAVTEDGARTYALLDTAPLSKVDAGPTPEPPPSPSATRHVDTAEVRKLLGMDEYEKNPVSDAKLTEAATKHDPYAVASKVLDENQAVKGDERISMGVELQKLRKQVDAAKNAGNLEEYGNLMDRALRLAQALDQSGSEAGRTLRATRLIVDENFDRVGLTAQLVKANDGKPLNATQTKQIEDLLAKEQDYLKQIEELKAQKAKSSVATAKSKNGRFDKAELDQELDALLKEFNSKAAKLSAGLDPELIPIVGKIALNYAKRGINTLDEVVAKVMEHLPNLTRQDVIDALGYTEPRPTKTELQSQISKLKAEAKKQATGYKEKYLSKRTASVQSQIAELERRIKEGDFSVKSKAETVIDKNLELIQAKRDLLRKRYAQMKADAAPKGIGDKAIAVMNLPRTLKAQLDLSAAGRQGWLGAFMNPKAAAKGFGSQIKALGTEEVAQREMNRIFNGENAPLYQKAGVEFTDWGGMHGTEEAMKGNLMRGSVSVKGKQVPNPFAATERAFNVDLNVQRAGMMDSYIRRLNNKFPNGIPDGDLKGLGNFVNVVTGRGGASIPGFKNAAEFMSLGLFSPRFLASRIEFLVGSPMFKSGMSGTARRMIAGEYAKVIGGLAGTVGLAYMGAKKLFGDDNVKLGSDTTSSDFGKLMIRDGKEWIRVDLGAGELQPFVFGSKLAQMKRTTQKGEVVKLNGENYGESATNEVGKFIRGKLNPALGIAWNLREGKDMVGQPYDAKAAIWDAVAPLSIQQAIEDLRKDGWSKADAINLLNFLGINVNKY